MHLRCKKTVTSSVLVSNGVKQDGIQWSILFNVNMNQLIERLNAFNIGGDILVESWFTIYAMQMIFV